VEVSCPRPPCRERGWLRQRNAVWPRLQTALRRVRSGRLNQACSERLGHFLTLAYWILHSFGPHGVVWFVWLCTTSETDVSFSNKLWGNTCLWENSQFKQNCIVLTKLSRPFRNYVTSHLYFKQLWIISQLSFLSFHSSATVAPFFPIWSNLINILYPYEIVNTIYRNSTENSKYTLSPANRKSLAAVCCSFAKHKSNGIPLLRETGCSMISLATNTALIFLNNRLSKFLQPTKIRQWRILFLNCKVLNNGNWLTISCILFHENQPFSLSLPPKEKFAPSKLQATFQAIVSFTGRTFYWGQDFGKMSRNSDCNLSNIRTYKQR